MPLPPLSHFLPLSLIKVTPPLSGGFMPLLPLRDL